MAGASFARLPTLFDKQQQAAAAQAAYEPQAEELYAQPGRLTTQVGWLKKNLVLTLTRPARLALVERIAAQLPRTQQAELLSLSRASLYSRPAPPAPAEVALKHPIDELFTAYPVYGSRRIAVCLRRAGHALSRQRVQRYLREMSLRAIYPGPNLSRRNLQHRVYPYLLRGLVVTHPNQVWGVNLT